jgi:hypothetical protein
MANTLTALAQILFAAARLVPREMTGYLGSVSRDFGDKGVALNDTIKVPVMPAMTAGNVTPSQSFTAGSDRVATTIDMTLSNFKEVSWNMTAEEELRLQNSQTAQDAFIQTLQQAMRVLCNTVESYVHTVAYKAASRAYGTAGTTPFASTVGDLAQALKILKDNGAPDAGLSAVLSTAAGANLRSLSNLFKVNEAGVSDLLRLGSIGQLYGMDIRESGQIGVVTKGTGSGYLVNNGAGYAVGDTTIVLDTGTGTILAGDVVTFAGDTNKYVVKTALASNQIVLQEPGLRAALADNAALTVGNNYTPNIVLHRGAIALAIRPALQPQAAHIEQMVITDPVTGLSFLLLRVVGNAMTSWYLRIVYDAVAVNPFTIVNLLG